MKKQWMKTACIVTILATALSACNKKDDAPVPDEQEVITTLRLNVRGDGGFTAAFNYKIENGFNNSTPGTIAIDTIKLPAGQNYQASLTVLNEKETPAEDITEEILEKNLEHLFLLHSSPESGAGALMVSEGSKDDDGQPLNQAFRLSTGTAGTGSFHIQLMHQPTNKNGATAATSGGETDLDAQFPVQLR